MIFGYKKLISNYLIASNCIFIQKHYGQKSVTQFQNWVKTQQKNGIFILKKRRGCYKKRNKGKIIGIVFD